MSPCGKKWYKIDEAHATMMRMRTMPNIKAPWLLSIYECLACEGWHVGHDYRLNNRPISLCVGEAK